MSLDERAFFTDKPESRPATYSCPRCRRTNEYRVRWVRRIKRDRLPGGADERDRAKFAKLRDHLLRLDEDVVCKTCGKKFEIPSQHSLLFLDQLEGLPRDVEEEESEAGNREPGTGGGAGSGEPSAEGQPRPAIDVSKLPARFTRPTRGWRG